ncbi:universal stress protein [Rhodococcoides yunnanense]|uniref:universal stress protein n=1 Tax=Rhodococcoides yunnanense TaxID=278209 RepID=UPI00353034E6
MNRAHALAAGSVDAQLLVVGTHGRGRVTETLYRSTTRRLVGHSPCPILICPTDSVVGDSARADRPTADPVDE